MACIKCENILNSKHLTIEEIKKMPYIKTDLIESRGREWYRCYCEGCGNTKLYYA